MNSLLLQAISEYLELSLRREDELVKENAKLKIILRHLACSLPSKERQHIFSLLK